MLTNLYTKVSPEKAALLVIDIQNDFCADDGYFDKNGIDVRPLQKMVPALERFIKKGRKFGMPILFIKAIYDNPSEASKLRHKRNRLQPDYCLSGTWGAEFYRITTLNHEPVVEKPRYNSFIGTDLDGLLKKLQAETVICTGTATNVCVESTARDAYSRDYNVVIVEDCCATSYGQEFHEMTLENCRRVFGEVCTSQELVDIWKEQSIPEN